MIRAQWITDTSALDAYIDYAEHFDQRAVDIAEEVYSDLADDVLDELRKYPPPPVGSKYKRTYRLKNGWEISIVPSSGGFTIEIRNTAVSPRGRSYPKRVVGSLATARATAAAAQAWMHKGRWPLAADTVNAWYELFMEEYQARFARDLAEFGTTTSRRRAYTR
jgi:hypothetical protein